MSGAENGAERAEKSGEQSGAVSGDQTNGFNAERQNSPLRSRALLSMSFHYFLLIVCYFFGKGRSELVSVNVYF